MNAPGETGTLCDQCGTAYPPGVLSCPKDGNPTRPQANTNKPHSMQGKFVGSYRILRPIGAGASGEVFQAEHPTLSKQVAVKILRPSLSRERELVKRFFAEAQAIAHLRHPSLVQIYDLSVLPDGRAYYVMDYLEGKSLAKHLREKASLSPSEAIPLAIELLDALHAAHKEGIIHRDLKPANIFLRDTQRPPRVVLLDFGIAKFLDSSIVNPALSVPGALLGTPAYMSPEQQAGRPITASSDLYAVGVLLFEMLTGELPFPDEPGQRRKPQEPKRLRQLVPTASRRLEDILLMALARHPAERYQTAEELAQDLADALDDAEEPLAATNPKVNPFMSTPKAYGALPSATGRAAATQAEIPLKTSAATQAEISIKPGSATLPEAQAARSELATARDGEVPAFVRANPRAAVLKPVAGAAMSPPPLAAKPVGAIPATTEGALTAVKTPLHELPAAEDPRAAPTARRPALRPWMLPAALGAGAFVLVVALLWMILAPGAPATFTIEVESNPGEATITLLLDGKEVAQQRGRLVHQAPEGARGVLVVEHPGYQNATREFVANLDRSILIQLAPAPAAPSSTPTSRPASEPASTPTPQAPAPRPAPGPPSSAPAPAETRPTPTETAPTTPGDDPLDAPQDTAPPPRDPPGDKPKKPRKPSLTPNGSLD